MRLGISTSLEHNGARDWAKKQHELGCKSVVFPLDSFADKKLINEYVDAAKEYDLVIAEVGIWRNIISSDSKERKANLDYAINQLALAEEIGANCAVNVAGAPFGKRWDGPYKENFSKEAWEKTVESVQTVIDAVNPTKTKYALEPMPWMIPTGPDEYLKLLANINRKQSGVHIDIVNMINCPERYFFQQEFMKGVFDKLGEYICSCHLKDIHLEQEYTFKLSEVKCGLGELDIEYYCELASKVNADMPMIIEHLKDDFEYKESFNYISERLKR